jgi:hypothetical protein
MTTLENEARSAGYVRDPNNNTRWYAGYPGLPELPLIMETHLEPDGVCVYGRQYATGNRFQMLRFNSFAKFLAYAKDNQRVSSPGLPAFSNAWD